jgi:peptidoglycan/xylan/chitin deacetylase (PgdA/CDA1 family)
MFLALKIDVTTLFGLQEGVPQLLEVLEQHNARATLFFALGTDRTGFATPSLLHKSAIHTLLGLSLGHYYGWRTLLLSTLLPGADMGARAANMIHRVKQSGHEASIQCYDPAAWTRRAAHNGLQSRQAFIRAYERFEQLSGYTPTSFSATGWCANVHLLRLEQQKKLDYACDCRGDFPFIPVVNAEILACPQIPVTLPTLDEMATTENPAPEQITGRLLAITEQRKPAVQVYNAYAELEGAAFRNTFVRLLCGWRDAGLQIVSLGEYRTQLEKENLPRHEIIPHLVNGYKNKINLQGPAFPGEPQEPAGPYRPSVSLSDGPKNLIPQEN